MITDYYEFFGLCTLWIYIFCESIFESIFCVTMINVSFLFVKKLCREFKFYIWWYFFLHMRRLFCTFWLTITCIYNSLSLIWCLASESCSSHELFLRTVGWRVDVVLHWFLGMVLSTLKPYQHRLAFVQPARALNPFYFRKQRSVLCRLVLLWEFVVVQQGQI